jgi:hypothetical protein
VVSRIGCLLALICLTLSGQIKSIAVGHEFRQDDWPSIASSPDGSLWVTWLSYVGERDDLAIRHYKDGQWSNLQWVPNTSGDNWMPQAGVDAQNRLWVVWPQQVNGNWDIYARRYDPAKQEWSALQRISSDPGSEFQLSKAQAIHVKAHATKAVKKVEIIKDSKVLYSTTPGKADVDFQFTDNESVSGRHYYYVRLQQDDGMLAWSSPFFINYQ